MKLVRQESDEQDRAVFVWQKSRDLFTYGLRLLKGEDDDDVAAVENCGPYRLITNL